MISHTPLPWFVGAQNDMLYITAGRRPSMDNDHPWHDAPRVAVAKIFSGAEGDVLPVDERANAAYIALACNAFPDLMEAAKELILAIEAERHGVPLDLRRAETKARAAIAKAERP